MKRYIYSSELALINSNVSLLVKMKISVLEIFGSNCLKDGSRSPADKLLPCRESSLYDEDTNPLPKFFAPVAQIYWTNLYPVNSAICFVTPNCWVAIYQLDGISRLFGQLDLDG